MTMATTAEKPGFRDVALRFAREAFAGPAGDREEFEGGARLVGRAVARVAMAVAPLVTPGRDPSTLAERALAVLVDQWAELAFEAGLDATQAASVTTAILDGGRAAMGVDHG